ncbi:MAG: hypothetical protein IJ727_05880 [Treponema sp.]|nr:hypothetical protein [Treponema sp.]
MSKYAILCGSAPKGFRQRKVEDKYDFLMSIAGGKCQPGSIVAFPSGVSELFLEGLLNEAFEKAADAEDDGDDACGTELADALAEAAPFAGDEASLNVDDGTMGHVMLYLCARNKADLSAELSDCAVPGVEVVRLGEDEVRKEVIAYYADLAEKMGIGFLVDYDWDGEFVREEELGWERGV